LSYDDLEIREGNMAALQYYRMAFEEMDLVEKIRISDALLQYCKRDTLAMLELRKALAVKAMMLDQPSLVYAQSLVRMPI
jgi:hypothetical protein